MARQDRITGCAIDHREVKWRDGTTHIMHMSIEDVHPMAHAFFHWLNYYSSSLGRYLPARKRTHGNGTRLCKSKR
jgi:hypothetical protein